MTTTNDFFAVLDLSGDFGEALLACFPESDLLLADSSANHQLSAAAAQLTLEHSAALRAAFAVHAPNAAAALLRLQYEALLRSAWLLYAASAGQVAKLGRTLDAEAELANKNLPAYSDMLAAIVRAAPAGLSTPLAEFNQYSRHALNGKRLAIPS